MTFDRSLGRSGFRGFGRGIRVEDFPETIPIVFNDFRGGYNVSTSRETIEQNSTPDAIDMEVSLRNRIVRLPGTLEMEVFADRMPTQTTLHVSLDNRSELIFFDPPFIGVKSAGDTVWTDIGLAVNRRIASVNFGGTLIFGNRVGNVFVRQAGAATLEQFAEIPQAAAYASFAGRVFGGGALIDGTLEPLGMVWSAANSNYQDWESLGAGFELLINDMSAGDRILSLNPMGLDFMAIVMRRSIWIARRTGLLTRPADFQPRVAGIGTVNADTVKSTLYGVVFLSDTGVYLFDGNTASLISEQINPELLREDALPVHLGVGYSATYDPAHQRYYLFTPTETFIYDMLRKRWYPSSMVAIGATIFAEQFEGERWFEAIGTWADRTETWAELSPQESGAIRMVFLGNDLAGLRTISRLYHGLPDMPSEEYFGVAQTPRWEFPRSNHPIHDKLLTIAQLNLEYVGEGTVDIWVPDQQGDMIFAQTAVLSTAAEPRLKPFHLMTTGKGAGLQIRNPAGRVEIISAQLLIKSRGPRIETPVI